jgi:ectoine hydroxylase-related dioxygenase (phytanoyl-CoA dioxygenase family)
MDKIEAMNAANSVRSDYERDGLVVVDFDLPRILIDEVAAFVRNNDDFKDSAEPSGFKMGARIQDAWRHNRAVRELAAHPTILEKLAEIYGKNPLPFQTLNFPVGTQQALHSDAFHFNAFPNDGSMCGVWIALEDMDENNGPLMYLAGSHKLPEVYPHNFGLAPEKGRSTEFAKRFSAYVENLNLERRHAIIKKGQGVIWAANVLHGGSPILDPGRTRLSQVTHYFFSGSQYYWTPLWSDMGRKHVYKRNPLFFDFNGISRSASLAVRLKLLIKQILPLSGLRKSKPD